jgi:single-strand DNA-binding protein
MPNYQKTIVVGHVGKDPETRYMPNGDAVTSFSVAYTEKGKSGDKTTWFNCATFKKTAEVASQYVKKGAPVLVEGRIQEDEWTDKDGAKRRSWKLIVDRLQLLGVKSDAGEPAKPKGRDGHFDDMDSDIPF